MRIYVDDDCADQIRRIATETGTTLSAVVRRALKEWLAQRPRRRAAWPPEVLRFKGIKGFPRFEDLR
jgi:hypothetical protein